MKKLTEFQEKVKANFIRKCGEELYSDYRGNGKTTRIVDRCIQELFTNGVTYVYNNRNSNIDSLNEILGIFEKRLKAEHNFSIENGNIEKHFDKSYGYLKYKFKIILN